MEAGGVRPWGLAWILLTWACASLAQPAGPPPPRGRLVDRVVALVDGALITQLDLELEASVLLIQQGAQPASTESLDEEVLAGVLELAINHRLLTRDADRLQAFPVDEAELEAKLRNFEERLGERPALDWFLARFEASRAQLAEVIRRTIRAERILDNKVRLRAQVSEDEVRRYYDAHAARLGASYEAVRASLREKLTAERYNQIAAAEVAQLRRKATIRRIAAFGSRVPEEAP